MHGVHAIANAAPATIGPPLPARSSRASTRHSLFSLTTKSWATKSTPMAMIRTPAILSSVSWFCRSVCVSPTAVRPRRMKITEKLAMNVSEGGTTLRQPAVSRSEAATPVTADR